MSGDFSNDRFDEDDARRRDERQPYGRGRGGNRFGNQNRNRHEKRQSFEIDDRLMVKLDLNLAYEIGNLILETNCDNPAVVTFAKQLLKHSGED